MSITTYAELREGVYNWLLRDSASDATITQDRVNNYISLCEAELSRELKVRELEEQATLTASTSTNTIDLPSDFRRLIELQYVDTPKDLRFLTRVKLREQRTSAVDRPNHYTIIGDKIVFDKTPDSAYTLDIDYYKEITALSDSNSTNSILTKYPDLYLYGTLKQALLNIMDQKRLAVIIPIYDAIVNRVKEEDKTSKTPSGSQLRTKKPLV